MFGYEKHVVDSLKVLKETHGLLGIKAEFEAEGSSFNDLVRLRRMTSAAGVELHLKIGGVEALRDIRDSVEIGVDGLIAPMVESRFGLYKFLEAYGTVYGSHRVHLAINIETRNSIEELDDILDLAEGNIDSVTLGRTDLSASYFDPDVTPDSLFIMELVLDVGKRAKKHGLRLTVGGSVSSRTVSAFRANPEAASLVSAIETRKVILPRESLLDHPDALPLALKFEEYSIRSKKEINDLMIAPELARLEKLSGRVGN
jgi:hypothetical protein